MASKKAHRKARRTHSQRITSVLAIQAAGVGATTMAGALVMLIAAPQATTARPVELVNTSSSLQATIDQILAEMQQAEAYDSGLPFATPASNAMLPTILQNQNYELLTSILSRVKPGLFFQSPEQVAADAADPRQYFGYFTPDIYYYVTAGLDPGRDLYAHWHRRRGDRSFIHQHGSNQRVGRVG
jgi:hypothetical protein